MLTENQILILLDVVGEAVARNSTMIKRGGNEQYKDYLEEKNKTLEEIREILYKKGG